MLCVDDMLLASSSKPEIIKMKNLLKFEFDMKDIGSAKEILGMVIKKR